MTTAVQIGTGPFTYAPVDEWERLPDGYSWTDAAAVAVDSKDRVYVFNRGPHPMIVFDPDGNILSSWGEGLFPRAHGVTLGPDDTLYCTDDDDHTVRQCTLDGRVLMTIGTPGQATSLPERRPVPPAYGRGHRPQHRRPLHLGRLWQLPRPQVHTGRTPPLLMGHGGHRPRRVQHRPQHRHGQGRVGLRGRQGESPRPDIRLQRALRDPVGEHAPPLRPIHLSRPARVRRRAGRGNEGQHRPAQHRPPHQRI